MARRKGGGGNRSAAAKKGWETRRRGGGGAKGKSKATPKTTTARGRARAAEAKARAAVKGGGGTRATRSLLTAQRARDFYKATGTGTKRSRTGGSGGAKPARATAMAAKPARGRGGAKPAATKRRPKTNDEIMWQADRIISKNNKIAARAIGSISSNGLQATQRIVGRSIRRSQYIVPGILARKGLLDEYARLTAPADPIRMTLAGPGLRKPRSRKR